jgi:hypothetical protein
VLVSKQVEAIQNRTGDKRHNYIQHHPKSVNVIQNNCRICEKKQVFVAKRGRRFGRVVYRGRV